MPRSHTLRHRSVTTCTLPTIRSVGRVDGSPGLFVDHDRLNTNHMDLCFQYPYQWSNTDDAIKHWLFVLPINERTTRMFFLFYFKALKIPLLPVHIPRFAMSTVLKISNRVLIGPFAQPGSP